MQKQSSELALGSKSSCEGRKHLPPGSLSPSLGSHPMALCSLNAQRPISDVTSFLLPPVHRDPLQHPHCSVPGAAQPHKCPIARAVRGVQPAPSFAPACSDLPGITTSNPSITINTTCPNNWPSSLTHCYPLVLDQLGDRHLPGELSAPGSTGLSSSLPDTQNSSPGPSDSS